MTTMTQLLVRGSTVEMRRREGSVHQYEAVEAWLPQAVALGRALACPNIYE